MLEFFFFSFFVFSFFTNTCFTRDIIRGDIARGDIGPGGFCLGDEKQKQKQKISSRVTDITGMLVMHKPTAAAVWYVSI